MADYQCGCFWSNFQGYKYCPDHGMPTLSASEIIDLSKRAGFSGKGQQRFVAEGTIQCDMETMSKIYEAATKRKPVMWMEKRYLIIRATLVTHGLMIPEVDVKMIELLPGEEP